MKPLDIATLVDSISNWKTWVVLFTVAFFGMLGGFAHKLTSPNDKTSGWGYIVVGAVASMAVLFIIVPLEGVRLVALALIAGYGGKAILNALEARVKVVLAMAETAKVKEEGKKAVKAGKEVASVAQKLSQTNKELEKALMKAKNQPRAAILADLKAYLPADVHSFVSKSQEDITVEVGQLSNRLDSFEESLK